MGRVPNKTHSMQILSGVKYKIIGCENWLLMLKIPCLIKANSLPFVPEFVMKNLRKH